ncbi:MAG TPA: FAD-dependent oxidoreductase [Candidatus Nitrosocosmicus sp.]|nr:FAD-dependent oxidoreductase [Candidatus Nitrosocosmicus sp.]
MKVAILGGGFTGLAAAYYLRTKGYEVTVYEREHELGGLAVGFKRPEWGWSLERAYHHLFATDRDILKLAKDTGFTGIFYQSPETASLYKVGDEYRTYPVDTPVDFMRFPLLNILERIRTAMVLAFLKLTPPLPIYNTNTSESFFINLMGENAWNTLFGQPMRKKFGKYAGNILASFIWARVKVRTKSLGYVEKGFQNFVEYLENTNRKTGVTINKGTEVQKIEKKEMGYVISYKDLKSKNKTEIFDIVISTLPSPILARIATIFPKKYFDRFKKLKYLNAVVLIIESKQPILEKTYWLSICTPDIPTMFIGQHTNFIDKKNYGGKHIAYIGWYIDQTDPLWNMSEKEIYTMMIPHIKKINPEFKAKEVKTYVFKAPFAQPVFDKEFVQNKPTFQTPLENFYIANLDMTYPNDRGTNYAVKLGREVSDLISR